MRKMLYYNIGGKRVKMRACSTTNQTALKQITLLQVLESSSMTPFCKNVLQPATS